MIRWHNPFIIVHTRRISSLTHFIRQNRQRIWTGGQPFKIWVKVPFVEQHPLLVTKIEGTNQRTTRCYQHQACDRRQERVYVDRPRSLPGCPRRKFGKSFREEYLLSSTLSIPPRLYRGLNMNYPKNLKQVSCTNIPDIGQFFIFYLFLTSSEVVAGPLTPVDECRKWWGVFTGQAIQKILIFGISFSLRWRRQTSGLYLQLGFVFQSNSPLSLDFYSCFVDIKFSEPNTWSAINHLSFVRS